MVYYNKSTLKKLDEWASLTTDRENRLEAKSRILSYTDTRSASLNLSRLHLSSLPDIFTDKVFNNLTSLNIQGNRITSEPASVNDLIRFRHLQVTRKLTFFEQVGVILIPSISDYKECNIAKDIWYTKNEMAEFKRNMAVQIAQYDKKRKNQGEDFLSNKEIKEFISSGEPVSADDVENQDSQVGANMTLS